MPSAQIVGLGDARLTTDGLALAFTITTSDGDLAVHIPTVDIGRIVAFFVGAGAACDDRFGPSERPFPTEVSAVPAQGLGLLTLDIPGQSGLLVRLAGFDLVFSVENTRLAEMARDMSPILATLAADGKPQ